ncbi:MAG: hypothetical protein V3571_05920 [Pseudodesulfovibrio sp.]
MLTIAGRILRGLFFAVSAVAASLGVLESELLVKTVKESWVQRSFDPSVFALADWRPIAGGAIVFLLWAFLYGVRRGLAGNGCCVKYRVLLSLVNPIPAWKAIKLLHEFHHLLHEKKSRMKGYADLTVGSDNVMSSFRDIVNKAQQVLSCALGVDVAVHIKMFESEERGGACVSLEQSVLKTYVRAPSRQERRRRDAGKLSARRNDEQFKVVPTLWNDIEKLKSDYPPDAALKVNSGYNYAFTREHYWVGNNLRKQSKKGTYYSTSENWELFYNSLAVFLISAPIDAGKDVGECPFGLFIVDSHETGRFDKKRLKYVGGYLAHRLHDFFTYWSQLKMGRDVRKRKVAATPRQT